MLSPLQTALKRLIALKLTFKPLHSLACLIKPALHTCRSFAIAAFGVTGLSPTLLALLSLYFLGGEVIRSFTFAMIFGVVIGTYSSIFIAAPVLIFLGLRVGAREDGDAPEAEAEPQG